MPDTAITTRTTGLTAADRRLNAREATRLVDVLQGRADTTTETAHYLVIARPGLNAWEPKHSREIEQYRDLERVVAQAADCETGDRAGKCLGAFTATYRDGKLASIGLVDGFDELVKAEIDKRPEDRLGRLAGVRGCMKEIV